VHPSGREGEVTTPEKALVYQALKEAASYTRVEVRKKEYLALAAKMKKEREEGTYDEKTNRDRR